MKFFADTRCYELSNGFKIYFFYRPGPVTETQIYVNAGSMHEGKNLGCGLSHFLEHMLFQGCRNYPEHAVADTVSSLGGELNANTSYDRTCYRIQLPSEHWCKSVDMLSSMIRFPELPEARFAAERDVILRECERGKDQVSRCLFEKFMNTAFLEHPVRHPVIGYAEMISAVTREMALEYHAWRYTPGRSFAVVVGDAEADEVFDTFADKFGDWKRKELAEAALPQEGVQISPRRSQIIFDDPVARLMHGVRVPVEDSGKLPALELLFGMLGTGDCSILNSELVLKKQQALQVGSFCFPAGGGSSVCGLSVAAKPEKLGRLSNSLECLLENVAAGKFSAAAMEREKGQQYADRLRNLRDVVNVANEIGGGVLYGGTPDAGDNYLEQLQKTDVDTLRAVAVKFLDSNKFVQVSQVPAHKKQERRNSKTSFAVETVTLADGVKMVYAPDHRLPLSCFTLVLPGGGIFEKSGQCGISSLTASLLNGGPADMSMMSFLKKLDSCGVDFSASSGSNSLIIEFSAPRNKFSKAMSLISKMLKNPAFREEDLNRERERIIEQLKVRAETPVRAAWDASLKLLFGSHPYGTGGHCVAGELMKLTVDDVRKFYNKLWQKENVTFAFGGDCTREEAVKLGNMFVEMITFNNGKRELPELPVFTEFLQEKVFALPRSQTVVWRSLPGPAILSEDALCAFDILMQMENGLASELFKSVREKYALSYSVGMNFSSGFHPGAINFYAMTAPESAGKVLELLNKEIERLASGKFSDSEFEAARTGAVIDCEREMDCPDTLLRSVVLDAYYGFEPEKISERRERLKNYSRTEFEKVLSIYFSNPDAGCAVTVLPGK